MKAKKTTKLREARLRAVQELLVAGLSDAEIAGVLQIDPSVVAPDLAAIRKRGRDRMKGSHVVDEAGLQADRYDALLCLALAGAQSALTLQLRLAFLRAGTTVLDRKTQFLVTTGLLPARASEVDLRVLATQAAIPRSSGPFHEVLNDPMRRHQVVKYMERLLHAAESGLFDRETAVQALGSVGGHPAVPRPAEPESLTADEEGVFHGEPDVADRDSAGELW